MPFLKSHYVDCLIKELGIDNSFGNPIYTLITLTKVEILDNYRSPVCSFEISTKDEELDLPSLYWISRLHKSSYQQRYIAGAAKCSTKILSKLLTSILSADKISLQSYRDTSYSIRYGFLKIPKICYSIYTIKVPLLMQ